MPHYAKVENWPWYIAPTGWEWFWIIFFSLAFLGLVAIGLWVLVGWILRLKAELKARRAHPVLAEHLRQKHYEDLHPKDLE